MSTILFVLLILLICIIALGIIYHSDIYDLISYSTMLIIGGKQSNGHNRNTEIENLRAKYSINNILQMVTKDILDSSAGQYVILNNKLTFTSEKLNPPYSGLIMLLKVKRINSSLLADIMISLSLREYAYIIVIENNDGNVNEFVFGTSNMLEDLSIGKSHEFLVKYLDNITDFSKTGLNCTDTPKYEKTNNDYDIKWMILSDLTEQDITKNLDWSEFLSKITDFCGRKYEVGGTADLVGNKVKILEVSNGNIGSVNVTHNNPIVFHSHPKSGIFAEPPSVTDLHSALHGFKDKSAAWDVVIAQEGLYIYRPSQFILNHEKEIRDKLDDLSIGCYRLKPSICVPIVLNRIRDAGYIIYFIPNPPYWKELAKNEYAFNYWNTIDNVKFLKTIEELRKYTAADFERLDWSEIKNVMNLSRGDNLIVADIIDSKVLVAGAAGARATHIHEHLGQAPGRYPGTVDIITQSLVDKVTGYELDHIINSFDYTAWCIILTPTKSYAIRSKGKSIKIDVKGTYVPNELNDIGFVVVEFGKI